MADLVSLAKLKMFMGISATDSSTVATSGGATQSGSTVTITTTAAHGLTAGMPVTVSGVTVSGYNGTWVIASVPSATTFTFTADTSGLASSGTGTVTGPRDGLLGMLISQCSARIEAYAVRSFATAASYTHYLSGNNTNKLILPVFPVNSITSIYLDSGAYWGQGTDPYATATLLTAGTDYALDKTPNGTGANGIVLRLAGVWPAPVYRPTGMITGVREGANGNIKITYNAGYSSVPADVQQACLLLCAFTSRSAKFGAPIQSESWGGYSYSLAGAMNMGEMPPEVKSLLNKYKTITL